MSRVFDWTKFLHENGIEYVERGANVGRGEINIRCAFCGTADPSFHMGLNTTSGFWACWRNSEHRGKSPLRLLVKLLNIPYWKARQLAGLDKDYVDPEGFDALAAKLMRAIEAERPEQIQRRHLTLPLDFQLALDWGSSRRHFAYLRDQRLFGSYTREVVGDYLLVMQKYGDMSDRIIFPYVVEDDLVTWTGRAIGHHPIRYKDLPIDQSIIPPKRTLYNHDVVISGGKILCVVEGPVDTVKMDYAGKPHQVRAVGLSTNSMSDDQIYLLGEAASQFERVVFLMDNKKSGLGAVDSMRLKQKVAGIRNAKVKSIPDQFKDCGEMLVPEAEDFALQLLEEL